MRPGAGLWAQVFTPAKADDSNSPCHTNRRKNDAVDGKEKEQTEEKDEPLNLDPSPVSCEADFFYQFPIKYLLQ
jgi:hypothetical protein